MKTLLLITAIALCGFTTSCTVTYTGDGKPRISVDAEAANKVINRVINQK